MSEDVSEDVSEEKTNRPDFYWGFKKVFVGTIQLGGTETFCLLRYWNIYKSNILNYNFMINQFKYFDQNLGNCYA